MAQRTATADQASNANIISVAGSTSSVSILASNNARKGVNVYNDSSSAMYLAFSSTASTSTYTVKISSGGYYEMTDPVYVGALSAVWDTATGNARITELY